MVDLRGIDGSIDENVQKMREQLVEIARRSHAEPQEPASVPTGALDLEDPMLEAARTDSAMRLFLEHMTSVGGDCADVDDQASLREEAFAPGEIQATRSMLAELVPAPTPDLTRGLDNERMWILIDLVANGDERARRQATLELRECIGMIESGELDGPTLRELSMGLQSVGRNVLLDLLLEAAESTSRRERG